MIDNASRGTGNRDALRLVGRIGAENADLLSLLWWDLRFEPQKSRFVTAECMTSQQRMPAREISRQRSQTPANRVRLSPLQASQKQDGAQYRMHSDHNRAAHFCMGFRLLLFFVVASSATSQKRMPDRGCFPTASINSSRWREFIHMASVGVQYSARVVQHFVRTVREREFKFVLMLMFFHTCIVFVASSNVTNQ